MRSPWFLLMACASTVAAQDPRPFGPNPAERYNPFVRQVPDPAMLNFQGPFYPVDNDPNLFRTRIATGTQLQTTNEVLDPSAILVGFDCTLVKGKDSTFTSLQPYYLVKGQKKPGNLIGSKSGGINIVVARDGYAVAKVEISTAGGPRLRRAEEVQELPPVTAMKVTFARMESPTTLSTTDTYDSGMIGIPSGVGVILDTMGFPACGITAAYTGKPSALGLLMPAATVRESKPGLVPTALPGRTPGAVTSNGQPLDPRNPFARPVPSAPTTPSAPVAPSVPVATIETPAASAIGEDPRMTELTGKAGTSFAFVQGQEGAGSAFVCNYQGKRVLFTNQHVIRENPALKFTLLNQGVVKLGAARAAVGHDIIAFDVADPIPALESDLDMAANVAIGDDVLVIGNTEGQGVIKPLPGKIVGLGPNLVEISSLFQPGNSGSPIIHSKTGRVIGLATFAIVRTVDSLTGARNPSVRRFGYRIDSIQQWQPVNWQIYQAEAAATSKAQQFTGSLVGLLRDLRNPAFNPANHTDSRLKPALGFLQPLMLRGNKSASDVARALQNFLGELKNVSTRDVEALRPQLRYDFFQRDLAEEAKVRSELAKALETAAKNIR